MCVLANGNWDAWSSWTCSDSSIQSRIRYRACTDGAMVNGGAYCVGDATETVQCTTATSSATPLCYAGGVAASGAAAAATCGCVRATSGTAKRGDGSTEGSCATSSPTKTCYSNGACRGKFGNMAYPYFYLNGFVILLRMVSITV